MNITRSPENRETSLTRDLLYAARYYLGGRRGLIALAALALVSGLALNWSWLVAAGIAPLLLGVLPCVAMCALGLCMNRMAGKSCSTRSNAQESAGAATGDAAATIQSATLVSSGPPASQLPSDPVIALLTDPEPQSLKERSTTDA
jgi:hypothetical protein